MVKLSWRKMKNHLDGQVLFGGRYKIGVAFNDKTDKTPWCAWTHYAVEGQSDGFGHFETLELAKEFVEKCIRAFEKKHGSLKEGGLK